MKNLIVGLVLGLVLATASNLNAGRMFDGSDYNEQQRYNNEKAGDPGLYDQTRDREWDRQRFERSQRLNPC